MRSTGNVAIISVVVVVFLVILAKARLGTGTPLHGGMPSGHAGVAFSIATSVAFSEVGLLVILLAWFLAATGRTKQDSAWRSHSERNCCRWHGRHRDDYGPATGFSLTE